jgi:hypothetical protein
VDARHYAAEVDVLGDPSARLAMFREAMDAGGYRRIGALSPDMGPAAPGQHFTFRETATMHWCGWHRHHHDGPRPEGV